MNANKVRLLIAGVVVGLVMGGGGVGAYWWVRAGQHTGDALHQEDHDGDHEDGPRKEGANGHEAADKTVRLSREVIEEFGVKVSVAEPGELKSELSLPGEVVVNPDRKVHVVPRVPGIAEKVMKSIGDSVRVGEVLAVMESAQLADAKAQYLARSKNLELARIDLDRTQIVYTNTKKMQELLKQSPDLEALNSLENLDLGMHRGDLLPAYAEFLAARVAHDRQERLLKDKIASEADHLMAESRYKKGWAKYLAIRDDMVFQNQRTLEERRRALQVAQVEVSSARRRLHTFGLSLQQIEGVPEESDEQLSHLEISASIDGIVIDRHISRGEKFSGDTAAFVIADLSEVWVYLTVYQKDLPDVRAGQPVVVTFGHGIPDAQSTIDYVSPVVEEATRTATARVVLENPQGYWRPGLFISARVQIDKTQVSVRVPRTALQTVDGETVVFVESEDGFHPRPVSVGRSNSTHIEITNGLEPGQRYVTENAFTLKAELGKGSLGGHHH